MKLWRGLVARWWVIYGIGLGGLLLGGLILWIVPPNPQVADEVVNYTSILVSSVVVQMVYFLLGAMIIALTLRAFAGGHWWRFIALVIATTTICVIWLAVTGATIGSRFFSPHLEHVDSIAIGDHHYHLAAYHNLYFPGNVAGHILYECVSITSCRKVRERQQHAIYYEPPLTRLEWDGQVLQAFTGGDWLFSFVPPKIEGSP